jgi:hypothetical protein
VEALGQRLEPVGDLVLGANRRHWVDGRRHPQAAKKKPAFITFT